MTIDEAIKYEEEASEGYKELYKSCPLYESMITHCDGTKDCGLLKRYGKNRGCKKRAEEYREIAELLKGLKREPMLDKIKAEIEQLPTMKCTETHRIYINTDDFKKNVIAILDKYRAESEDKE